MKFLGAKAGDSVFVVFQQSMYQKSTKSPTECGMFTLSRVGKKYAYFKRYSSEVAFNLYNGTSHHADSNARANGFGFDVFKSEAEYIDKKFQEDEFYRLKKRMTGSIYGKFINLPAGAVAEIHAVLDRVKEEA